MQNKKTTIFLLTAACFLAFFVFGFTDNLKGPTLPAMMAELKIPYGTGSNVLFGEYLGFLVATLITGILADRFGLKVVLVLAGVCLFFGVGGYSTFGTPILLSISLFVIGLGLGALELGPNAIIVSLHHERKGLFLNLMAVLHGFGSMLAPLFASWLFAASITWRTVYRWDIPLIILFTVLFLFLRLPKSEESAQLNFHEIPRVAFKHSLPWFYAAITLYVAAEIGMASWMVTFLQDIRGATVQASNQSLSIFFATMMIGRLLGGFFVQRVGYLRSIFFATIGAILCIVLGLFVPSTAYLLPVTGLFFSIVFPTITAAVSDSYKENINTILGVLFTFAGVGGLIGPLLVGWGSDFLGLQMGFAVNLAITIMLLISVGILMKGTQYGKNS